MKRHFTPMSADGAAEIESLLKTSYFPSWYGDAIGEDFFLSADGQAALENHMYYRLEMDRHEFIPWLASVVQLDGARILEIGSGTGSAAVAMAEQGADVVGVDVHEEGLQVADARARAHGLDRVEFVVGNAEELDRIFSGRMFDVVVFFAVLEHMTLPEREAALRAAWNILPAGKHLCITETPNRLWFYDGHTSRLPFYHWLPDDIAFRYSRHSPRYPFNVRFREADPNSVLSFLREGRGFSYHEMDLAWDGDATYRVCSDKMSFLVRRNPAKLAKYLASGDARRERLLHRYAPDRHRAFFRQHLDLLVQKL